jgi:hypothetical protein
MKPLRIPAARPRVDAALVRCGLIAVLLAGSALRADSQQPLTPMGPVDPKALRQQLQDLCDRERNTDNAELGDLKTHTSTALQNALRSAPEFWSFFFDPSTSYRDRMAAAWNGGGLIPAEQMPLFWQAISEIEKLPTGVHNSPCIVWSAVFVSDMWTHSKDDPAYQREKSEPHSVVGKKIKLPDQMVEYPVIPEDREHAPWVWQMKRALPVLGQQIAAFYEDHPERYPALVEVALQGQPPNWKKASTTSRIFLTRGPRTALWLQMAVRIALEDDDPYVASIAVPNFTARGELAATARIVILENTQREQVARASAYSIADCARRDMSTNSTSPSRSATAILAIGRWAMDRNLDPSVRFHDFVTPLVETVDNPPFPPSHLFPKSDELPELLATFGEWFEKNRASLEKQAAVERPHLESLASELRINQALSPP